METGLKLLSELSNMIEGQFDTVILRKSVAHKDSSFFSKHQFSSSILIKDIYEHKYESKLFKMYDDPECEYMLTFFVPITDEFFIITHDLKPNGYKIDMIVFFLYTQFNVMSYIGGTIKMSYKLEQELQEKGFYGSKDILLVNNLYEIYEQVRYCKIVVYI
jgi:hypothetical protein